MYYFLCAGASKAFGYPLTRDILPNVIKGINEKTLFKQDKQNKNLYIGLLIQCQNPKSFYILIFTALAISHFMNSDINS